MLMIAAHHYVANSGLLSADGPVHAIFSVLGVYIVCSVLDMLRIKLIEKPVIKQIEKSKMYGKDNIVILKKDL